MRFVRHVVHSVALYLLLLFLGLMSLGWNLIAVLLYPLLPRESGTRATTSSASSMLGWLAAMINAPSLLSTSSALVSTSIMPTAWASDQNAP